MIDIKPSRYDFGAMHESLEQYVSDDLLVMAASVVLEGQDVVDVHTVGLQDRDAGTPVALDSIYRIFSNTKIVTSVAAMMLWEEGAFGLDDELASYFPEFEKLRVVKAGEPTTETEPLARAPTVRQLLCHNAGFSYGIFAESPVDELYVSNAVTSPNRTLEEMVTVLADIPLAYQPGARFQYSVSTDLVGRLVEILAGQPFDEFLQQRIFLPLGMVDTGFFVPEDHHDRLCANYVPLDPMKPMQPGLKTIDESRAPYTRQRLFLSGGGGLVSTIIDYTKFIQMLVGQGSLEGTRLLQSDTVAMMRTNQLPDGVGVQLPNWLMPETVFGLGLAIKTGARPGEPPNAVGECHWGGVAGTHSWMSPEANVSGIVFTQRQPGFWHPFSHDFKRLVYDAVTG